MRQVLLLIVALVLPVCCWAHGDLHERIEALTEKTQRAPNDAVLYLQRGELNRVHEDWAAATADYNRAVELDPKLSVVDLARGRMLFEAGSPREALVSLGRFIAKNPEHAEAFALRARVRVKLREYLPAAEDFSRAIHLAQSPEPEYFIERAQALAAVDPPRLDDSVRGLDEGIAKLGPLVTLETAAIELELRQKRFDAALARVDKLSAASPRKETWLFRRGEILEQAGRPTAARQAFAAALKAIESLPPRLRQTKAIQELESQLRSKLDNGAPHAPQPTNR